MTNIPTDLLRTFVAVVDLRSFTKAAALLGVTQPAVSAQIKRLQFLLGGDLFDRSSQGIRLTPHGEMVVSYSRRLLSINDQIVRLGSQGPRSELVIRVGSSSDFVASLLPDILARFRERLPDIRFNVRTAAYEPLLRELRNGDLDVFIGMSLTPPHDARRSCPREIVWARSPDVHLDLSQPVPLVTTGESCVYHRLAVSVLKSAGLEWQEAFTGPSLASLDRAVAAGLGVMPMTRGRAKMDGLATCDEAELPKLPDLYSGIFVREGGARPVYEQLADEIAAVIYRPVALMPVKETSAA